MKRYAISDIHGCNKTFRHLVEKRINLQKEDHLYLLGDYIDRGPGSKQVFDFIFELQESGYQVHCLRGNHEEMMLNTFHEKVDPFSWMVNGGDATLDSFEAVSFYDIPEQYIQFIENLPYYFVLDDYLLVHAGFEFKKAEKLADLFEDQQAMIWLRYWYNDINPDILGGRTIVHGHTPVSRNEIEKSLQLGIPLDIDGGCVYHPSPRLGYLCAFDMDDRQFIFERNLDYQKVV